LFHLRAMMHHENRAYDLAIADNTRAIELDGNHFGAFRARAAAFAMTRNFEHARGDALRALELKPGDVDATRLLSAIKEMEHLLTVLA
jgi:hypothetical protein